MQALLKGLTIILVFALLNTGSLANVVYAQTTDSTNGALPTCKSGDGVVVPNFLGLSPARAKQLAEECDLTWRHSEEPSLISYERIGFIGMQEPSAGASVSKGSEIRGFSSKGLFLPSMIGWRVVDAESWIREIRMDLNKQYVRNKAPIGTIVAQTPKQAVFFDRSVIPMVTVSEGLWVVIPNVKDKPYSSVSAQLKALGLSPVHAGGDLSSGYERILLCEAKRWYPVIESVTPIAGVRVYEGDTVMLTTKRKVDLETIEPPQGQKCG